MDFRKILLSDKEVIGKILYSSGLRGGEYNFANNYNWSVIYNIEACIEKEFVILKSSKSDTMLYPAGKGDEKAIIEKLLDYSHSCGRKLAFHCVPEEKAEFLSQVFPEKFDFEPDRDLFDYIYTREKLATLKGKKLHSKRNHINYFEQTFTNWKYEEITRDNISHVQDMNREWCKIHKCTLDPELKAESCAVKSAFQNFFELNMRGGFITDGERIVGYTMASPTSADTIDVHIEKAFSDVRGAYPMINKQFALNSCDGFVYLNREEDTGDEGLRKAKLSYVPEILLKKYNVRER